MTHYYIRLNPARPTFAQDMTDEERAIMDNHGAYWTDKMHKGTAVCFGPVFDPSGFFGVAVAAVKDEDHLKELIANDPAAVISTYDYYPMRAIYPARD